MSATIKRHAAHLVQCAGAKPDQAVGLLCILILAALPWVLSLEGCAA